MEPAEFGSWIGIVGGIVGCAAGLAGGLCGTWFSIRNTRGPLERSFIIKTSVVGWVLIAAFLGAMLALPAPQRFFLWIPYAIVLPLGIMWINRRQAELRRSDCCDAGAE